MEQITSSIHQKLIKPLSTGSPARLLAVVAIASIGLGILTGLILSTKDSKTNLSSTGPGTPKTAQQDSRTFRDFAEGVLQSKPQPTDPSEYTEGTHILQREGEVPVALTSSVVDLSKYEGKKVKVFGETQKALIEGWLMDVGRVEEIE